MVKMICMKRKLKQSRISRGFALEKLGKHFRKRRKCKVPKKCSQLALAYDMGGINFELPGHLPELPPKVYPGLC